MIVSDIDGTLVGNDGIPAKNIEKLRYFTENGGLFTVSTGRNHTELRLVSEPLKELIHIPFSVCNGSALYDVNSGEFVNPRYVDITHLETFIEFINQSFPGKIRFHSAADETGTIPRLNGKMPPLDGKKLFKILFFAEPSEIRAIYAAAIKKFETEFTFTLSASCNFEVLPYESSKMSQFPYLKTHYDAKEIWAIGDYDNDIEMLRGADFAVCPENATDTVKAVADHIVCRCEDGALADLVDLIEKRNNTI